MHNRPHSRSRRCIAFARLTARTDVPTSPARESRRNSSSLPDRLPEVIAALRERLGAAMHGCHVLSTTCWHMHLYLAASGRAWDNDACVYVDANSYGSGGKGIGSTCTIRYWERGSNRCRGPAPYADVPDSIVASIACQRRGPSAEDETERCSYPPVCKPQPWLRSSPRREHRQAQPAV